MIYTKKIKAFTISELVVALLITTIVVGIAFSVLNLIQKQLQGIEQNFKYSDELKRLEQQLWIDFNRYQTIRYDAVSHSLFLKNELDSVFYIFEQTYLLKGADTIDVGIEGNVFYFDGTPVSNGLIDAVELTTSKTFQHKKIFIYKQNDASQYMN
ncbi:hypothetical protein [Leptobacterium sp. I13]|uniref:PulJ/GspJ family protein n=1 Tax=Leptobacterium meishanense TaxID=3128904 RepID=UPI0030ECC6B9